MIYIPMLKTRQEEMKVAKDMNRCFSDKIIPLFEIIKDEYENKFEIDPLTNEPKRELRNGRSYKIKAEATDDDIITLDYVNSIVDNKVAFIDYFRYTRDKYGNNIDISKAELSYKLNDDFDLYKERLTQVSAVENFIPVISIKKGFDMTENKLKNFIEELRLSNNAVAIRITEEYLEKYSKIIQNVLDDEDFLLFDIQEQRPGLKFMELEAIGDLDIKSKVILLNSPRSVKKNNGEYPENGFTDLIDNSARHYSQEYGLDGYGDYCGLKDQLPSNAGNNGTGAALALIYDYNKNQFWAYTNKDTKMGMRGYRTLLPIILSDQSRFDPNNDCEGYKKINGLPSTGNWSTWHNICARRYICQIYKNTY